MVAEQGVDAGLDAIVEVVVPLFRERMLKRVGPHPHDALMLVPFGVLPRDFGNVVSLIAGINHGLIIERGLELTGIDNHGPAFRLKALGVGLSLFVMTRGHSGPRLTRQGRDAAGEGKDRETSNPEERSSGSFHGYLLPFGRTWQDQQ